jgi:hypothetical protein
VAGRSPVHFCTNTVDIRIVRRHAGRKNRHMEHFNEVDAFLDAVDHVVLVALKTIGNDPAARFALFKGILGAAQEVVDRRKSRSTVPSDH